MTHRSRSLARTVGRLLPACALSALLWALAATPDLRFAQSPNEDLLVRKLGHAAVYGVLSVLWHLGLPARLALPARPGLQAPLGLPARLPAWTSVAARWLVPLTAVVAVAVVDELIQSRTQGREGKLLDVLTDLSGAVAALVLLRSLRYRRSLRHPATCRGEARSGS